MSLELGGKSAAVVLDDADLATVVPRVVGGACTCRARCAAPTPACSCPAPATPRRSTPPRRPPQASPTATRTTRRPWSARWWPSASATGSRATSGLAVDGGARVVAGGARPAAPAPGLVRPAHDPGRRRQRHAGGARGDLRARAVLHRLRRRRRRRAHRQRLAVRPVGRGVERRRRPGPRRRPAGCAPAASPSTGPTRRSRWCRSAGSSSRASAASSAPRAWPGYLEPRSIGLPRASDPPPPP